MIKMRNVVASFGACAIALIGNAYAAPPMNGTTTGPLGQDMYAGGIHVAQTRADGFHTMPMPTTTLTVCASGCQYSSPLDAANAAKNDPDLARHQYIVSIADGTYNINGNFFSSDPYTRNIKIVGDTNDQTKVILNFTNTQGLNLTGFMAFRGGFWDINGVTITQPIDGTGALKSTDSTGRHIWNANSYGGGVGAMGMGSIIHLGPRVNISNFYYSAFSDDGGGLYSDGYTQMRTAGDVNMMARGNSVAVCLYCYFSDASDYTWPANPLGSNVDAERGGSVYVDYSTGDKSLVNGYLALTNGSMWAHNVTLNGGPISASASGLTAWSGGSIEATSSTIQNYNVGVSATATSSVAMDNGTIQNNNIGEDADGGFIGGSNVTIKNNKTYGIQSLHGGNVIHYGTAANFSGNGTNISVMSAGTSSNGSSWGPSSVNVQ